MARTTIASLTQDNETLVAQLEELRPVKEQLDSLWVVGDDFTLADIAIAPFIERFEANKMSKLVDWVLRPSLGNW